MALNIGSLFGTLEIRGTSQAIKSLDEVQASFTETGTAAGRAGKSVDESATAMVGAGKAANLASSGSARFRQAQLQLFAATQKYTALLDDENASLAQLARAEATVIGAQERLSGAIQKGAASTRELASAQATVVKASDRVASAQMSESAAVEKSAARTGEAISMVAKIAAVAGTVIGYEALKQAGSFQQATNVYVTAAGESQKNLEVVRTGIENVAKSTGTSIDQLTAAEYVIEKAGDRGASGLRLLAAAAQGAREENANLADVVNAATSVMASYHLGTASSVQVINALKTGAGQAKVTMEEYAKSLSTVIPVASAAKLSLGETLGAISTLTQHGTSAAEATQELASTIRNLQAPNSVAAKAMQQLGLNVNDVSKNLGTRGLTGTIDLLTNAIASKMGSSGLVAVSAFKKSQSASADLQVELNAMPASLAKISKSFADGSLSYKDYYTDVKALGGQQYELGKSFISTMTQAQGFNDLLKSGSPAAQTFVAYLKRVTGGAIGMNTALQLGGQNLAGFKSRTDAVNRSLHDSSTSVEGWSSTQKLFSVSADRAKETLQVLGIELGDHLLPIATQVMSWFADTGVHDLEKFGNGAGTVLTDLSHVLRTVFGLMGDHQTTVLALAGGFASLWAAVKGYEIVTSAAGAVKALVATLGMDATAALGRSARAFSALGAAMTGNGAQATATAQVMKADFAQIEASALEAAAEQDRAAAQSAQAFAEMVAASDDATASMIANSQNQARAAQEQAAASESAAATSATAAQAEADAVDTASAEASIAWGAMLGPIGLVAAGVAGAIGALHLFGGAAKSAIGPEDDLTAAILKNNGALGTNVRAIISSKLANDGAYDAAAKLGISVKTLTNAVLGHGEAQIAVNTAIIKNQALSRFNYGAMTADQKAASDAADKLKASIGNVTGTLKASQHVAAQEAEAQATAAKNDKARAVQLKQLIAVQQSLTDSYKGLDVQVGTYGTTLDKNTKAGKANTAFVQSEIEKANSLAKTMFNAGGSIDTVTSVLGDNTKAFEKQAVQAGFSQRQIDALIKTYRLTPKQIVTNMLANISKATASATELQGDIDAVRQRRIPGLTANNAQGRAVIAALQARIDALTQHKKPMLSVDSGELRAQVAAAQSILNGLHGPHVAVTVAVATQGGPGGHHATGGYISGPGTGTSDDISAPRLSNGEFVINARQTAKYRKVLEAMNKGVAGFATGGLVGAGATGENGPELACHADRDLIACGATLELLS